MSAERGHIVAEGRRAAAVQDLGRTLTFKVTTITSNKLCKQAYLELTALQATRIANSFLLKLLRPERMADSFVPRPSDHLKISPPNLIKT